MQKLHRFAKYFKKIFIFFAIGINILSCKSNSAEREILGGTSHLPTNNFDREIGLKHNRLRSSLNGEYINYSILIPRQFSNGSQHKRTYNVLYWLHGANGLGQSLIPLSRRFKNCMEQGLSPDTFVVFPESDKLSMWVDSENGLSLAESVLIKDILPSVEMTYPISQKPEERHIAGFSMGGYGAARIGLKYSKIFGNVAILAAGTLDTTLSKTPRATESIKRRLFEEIYGGSNDYFYSASPRFLAKRNKSLLSTDNFKMKIFVGDADEVLAQNIDFAYFIKGLGINVQMYELSGVSHSLKQYVDSLDSKFCQILNP
jgi:S-formylglutathione hydrolase FrmB